MQYMPNVVPRLDSSSIWCAQIFALNTTTRSRHNRHQVQDSMSEGKAQEGGRSYAEANANRAGQTSSKLAHAKGPTAAALILAHINALKMH